MYIYKIKSYYTTRKFTMEIPSGYASYGSGGAIERVTGSVPREQLDRTGQSLIVVNR